jgi:hypothetical protein
VTSKLEVPSFFWRIDTSAGQLIKSNGWNIVAEQDARFAILRSGAAATLHKYIHFSVSAPCSK